VDDAATLDDLVFKALADPTRRLLLDALFERDGQTVQALCERCPGMTRFGVMKHLGLLEAANLVTTRRAGRSKLHFLNPVPIQQLADRWISKYAQPFTRALLDLQTGLEQQPA
jgi:DNA-binding transcriptional ArsR family regulator